MTTNTTKLRTLKRAAFAACCVAGLAATPAALATGWDISVGTGPVYYNGYYYPRSRCWRDYYGYLKCSRPYYNYTPAYYDGYYPAPAVRLGYYYNGGYRDRDDWRWHRGDGDRDDRRWRDRDRDDYH